MAHNVYYLNMFYINFVRKLELILLEILDRVVVKND